MMKIVLECNGCGTKVEDKVFYWNKKKGDAVVPCKCGGMFIDTGKTEGG